jgi:hypothetical protein
MVTVAYVGSGADAGRDDAIAVILVADLLGALADLLVLRRAHAITGQGRSGALRGRCPWLSARTGGRKLAGTDI